MTWVLVAVLAVPAVGAVFRSRAVAAGAAAIAFLLSVALATGRSDGGLTGPIRPWHQLDVSWVPGLNLRFHLGVEFIHVNLSGEDFGLCDDLFARPESEVVGADK